MHSLRQFVLVLYIYFMAQTSNGTAPSFGTRLVTELREDANLDLPVDEEYEDLRAELLAYHTAFASLASPRRSLITTPCWNLGGICINSNLCTGFRYLTEVPGCKDKLKVCCFAWNRYNVRDWRDFGINTLAMPWSMKTEFGGKGLSVKNSDPDKKKKKAKKLKKKIEELKEEEQKEVEPKEEEEEEKAQLRSQVVAVILKGDK